MSFHWISKYPHYIRTIPYIYQYGGGELQNVGHQIYANISIDVKL